MHSSKHHTVYHLFSQLVAGRLHAALNQVMLEAAVCALVEQIRETLSGAINAYFEDKKKEVPLLCNQITGHQITIKEAQAQLWNGDSLKNLAERLHFALAGQCKVLHGDLIHEICASATVPFSELPVARDDLDLLQENVRQGTWLDILGQYALDAVLEHVPELLGIFLDEHLSGSSLWRHLNFWQEEMHRDLAGRLCGWLENIRLQVTAVYCREAARFLFAAFDRYVESVDGDDHFNQAASA
ncbi:hypothetical protein GFC01_12975 [Desulfofundulus thermobenzoicus]|uniref:Uncharacterized protein n=1 Tax=Desulfofundulus thermobenzoicus TaxID=29376 RepID=A0A6N7ISW9_9FIRM|nr:hypothetical protein [Desulfofundulus thermobenzoicus]MQL53152.1 hypothetical protein [Desulfofundulus thermobenzoicus]